MGYPIIKNILLADDDKDDCLFFKDALDELAIDSSLKTVHDGEELLKHLETVSATLPNVLFLDLNMPRKNGFECLIEIKKNELLKTLPIIIYSTSHDEKKVNLLYDQGAHYYICKPSNFEDLKNVVYKAIKLLEQSRIQVTRESFFINKLKIA